jgi:hypothetical protein
MFLFLKLIVTKNDRCSLAAKILYSNFQQKPNEQLITKFDRVMRPSTLSKTLITATTNEGFNIPSSLENSKLSAKSRLYENMNNSLLKVSVNNYKQNSFENDNQFPTPPSIPLLEQPHQHNFSKIYTQSPTIIQDYQEPQIKSSLKATQNNSQMIIINSEPATKQQQQNYSSNLIFNIEDEFKRKVNYLYFIHIIVYILKIII